MASRAVACLALLYQMHTWGEKGMNEAGRCEEDKKVNPSKAGSS